MPQILLDLLPERRQAPVVDDVFEPGALAVGPVAEVAEDFEHGLADFKDVGPVDVAERHREERERLLRARRGAQSAAHEDVVPDDRPVLDDGQKPQVVRMHVGAIVVGEREGGLELPGEVRLAVERLDRVVARRRHERGPGLGQQGVLDLLAVAPDLPVAGRPRGGVRGPRIGVGLDRVVQGVADRRGAAQDVPLDVAAGRQGRQQGLVDRADRRRQVRLQDAVELELLPGRDPQGAVADRLREPRARQVLVGRRELPARHPDPDHEGIGFVLPFLLELATQIPVVLLVRPVELQDGPGVLADVVLAVDQLLGQDELEVLAGDLDGLDLAELPAGPLRPGRRGVLAFARVNRHRRPSPRPTASGERSVPA